MARWTTRLIRGAALAAATGAASPAFAEPYIAMRAGLKCSGCHVNHTGAGKRTAFGVAYGLERLPQWNLLPEGQEPFKGDLGGALRIGADFRGVLASRVARSDQTLTFATQEWNLYGDLALVPDRLHLYADVRVAPGGAASREIFGLVDGLPGGLYVKAGQFFAPFGWRLLDDTAFVRARTGFGFFGPDDGVEMGWEPGDFSASLAFTNGNGGAADDNTNKRVSMVASWVRPRFRIGSSFASNKQGEVSTLLGGLLGGVKLGERFVALAEADVGSSEDDLTGETARQVVGYAEGDFQVGKGWNLKAAFDYHDPDRSESGDEVNRISLGLECFAAQYVQFRVIWRRTDRPPQVHGVLFEDDREAVLELHMFL